jgi:hypothetical protein
LSTTRQRRRRQQAAGPAHLGAVVQRGVVRVDAPGVQVQSAIVGQLQDHHPCRQLLRGLRCIRERRARRAVHLRWRQQQRGGRVPGTRGRPRCALRRFLPRLWRQPPRGPLQYTASAASTEAARYTAAAHAAKRPRPAQPVRSSGQPASPSSPHTAYPIRPYRIPHLSKTASAASAASAAQQARKLRRSTEAQHSAPPLPRCSLRAAARHHHLVAPGGSAGERGCQGGAERLQLRRPQENSSEGQPAFRHEQAQQTSTQLLQPQPLAAAPPEASRWSSMRPGASSARSSAASTSSAGGVAAAGEPRRLG